MAWLRWQQHRADRDENRAIRTYLNRREGHQALCDIVVDASRRADARWRLDARLDRTQPAP